MPFGQIGHHLSANHLSTLFLQLTVEDMGICLPLNPLPLSSWPSRSCQDFESRNAVVITLENTIISACNSGSLVSTGKFFGLCLRFADDFETTLDDWKPNMNDGNIMNLCVVSEGTYEVCSRTIAAKRSENAKWILNVKWQMEGVDIHLDINIGKQLSSLGHTLTTLSGFEEDEGTAADSPDSEDGEQTDKTSKENLTLKSKRKALENFPAFLFDPTLDSKKRSLMMEKEMNEQLKIINDLRTLGASSNTVIHEERRLQELQALCYKYFRRDMIQKWKRPSMRKAMLKSTNRSQSFVASSPTHEELELERASVDACHQLDTIMSNDCGESTSLQSSPYSGPSRSASLRIRVDPAQRVSFSDTMRQSSLPSADSETSFPETGMEWPMCDDSDISEIQILDINGESVELRRKNINYSQKSQEPSIDFELDIKVLVNSGKCVLHTKDLNDDKLNVTTNSSRHHKRERSIGTDWGSPIPSRRNKDKNRLRYNNALNAVLVDLTIFHIPGLDVKLHYKSKTVSDDCSLLSSSSPPRLSSCDPMGLAASTTQTTTTTTAAAARRLSVKRASLFAWMTLQSIPEETIISPHILEFLEQTLEPIPFKSEHIVTAAASPNPVNIDLLQENYVAYSSFPVDVIVYFHMQPSTFRFSCLPVSRVECMLQLPSLDIVFSSKRQDDDRFGGAGGGLTSAAADTAEKSATGGLSVTGCLADFNVYIFHPYGGKKSGFKEAQFSPLADSERKDSLSINVEFVKFHLTRSRKMNFEHVTTAGKKQSSEQSRAVIRFSTIVDIGSASFKYDMRRLTEILAFPKAWYRRRIVRRLFLGDLSVPQSNAAGETSGENISKMDAGAGGQMASGVLNQGNTVDKSSSAVLQMQRDKLRLSLDNDVLPKIAKLKETDKSSSFDSNATPSETNQITAWETLVLFAFNFTKLNVQMNMGNVMGNVIWLTKAFRSDGRLSIGSTGHKNMYIGIALGGSALDAKGGIVGGTFEMNKIDTHVHIREEPGVEPHHTVGIKLVALELRLDYMGTSVLMTRISSLNAALRDEWKCTKEYTDRKSASIDGRPTIILIHGDLSWDQLQIMISKSTTADLLKMYYKLDEFFSQQFKSSKRVFSNLEPRLANRSASSVNRKNARKSVISTNSDAAAVAAEKWNIQDARHHRHWQKPLKQAMGLILSTLEFPLPNFGTVLGGTMELHGRNISLACFHGVNFKAKSWALFSLRDPCINFATEAKQVEKTNEVNVIQTLTFALGMSTQIIPQNHSMATVCRMSRNIIFPPQFKTLHEWFHYAFANSEIDGNLILILWFSDCF